MISQKNWQRLDFSERKVSKNTYQRIGSFSQYVYRTDVPQCRKSYHINRKILRKIWGPVIRCCRYCFHDKRDPFILLSILVQTYRELYLQIFQDLVNNHLVVFVYCFYNSVQEMMLYIMLYSF